MALVRGPYVSCADPWWDFWRGEGFQSIEEASCAGKPEIDQRYCDRTKREVVQHSMEVTARDQAGKNFWGISGTKSEVTRSFFCLFYNHSPIDESLFDKLKKCLRERNLITTKKFRSFALFRISKLVNFDCSTETRSHENEFDVQSSKLTMWLINERAKLVIFLVLMNSFSIQHLSWLCSGKTWAIVLGHVAIIVVRVYFRTARCVWLPL